MRKIFLDCGANLGQSVYAWYLCNEDADEYEIYSFEASARLIKTLTKNLKKYKNVKVINKVVWSHNEGVKFNDCGNESSSTEKDKLSGGAASWQSPTYPSLDLAKFIKENFTPEDKIILKIDIEGGEYHLVPHLIKSGAMSYIDEIYMEPHAAKLSSKTIEDDYEMIKMLKDENLVPMLWTANWTIQNNSYKTKEREMTEEYIVAMWKRKGRYRK